MCKEKYRTKELRYLAVRAAAEHEGEAGGAPGQLLEAGVSHDVPRVPAQRKMIEGQEDQDMTLLHYLMTTTVTEAIRNLRETLASSKARQEAFTQADSRHPSSSISWQQIIIMSSLSLSSSLPGG